MESVNNDFILKYLSQLQIIMRQIDELNSVIISSDFRGISADKTVSALTELKNDISQHFACIQSYEEFIKEVMN